MPLLGYQGGCPFPGMKLGAGSRSTASTTHLRIRILGFLVEDRSMDLKCRETEPACNRGVPGFWHGFHSCKCTRWVTEMARLGHGRGQLSAFWCSWLLSCGS